MGSSPDVYRVDTYQLNFEKIALFNDGSIPMQIGYTPELAKDIVTKEYADTPKVLTQYVATDFTPDLDVAKVFNLTLTANLTVADMINTKDGDKGSFRIIQDATGGWTIAGGAFYRMIGFVPADLSTVAGTTSYMTYEIVLGECVLELVYTGV